MKNFKKNSILFFTLFIFTMACTFTFLTDNVYANSNFNNKEKIEYNVALGKISSGSFSSKSSSGFSSKSSSSSFSSTPKSSSFSKPKNTYTKPKTTNNTKTDSGNFSTKPKSEINNKSDSYDNSTKSNKGITKPDSGNFSTKSKNKSKNENDKSNEKKYDDYGQSRKRTYIPSSYGRGFFGFGGYNPFRYMGYRMGISPIITDIVMIITMAILLYIAIDFIKNRRKK